MSARKYCNDPDNCEYGDCPTAFCDRHKSASETPISDSLKRSWDRNKWPDYESVPLSDCRAIERRLNACVEALECMLTAEDITPNMIAWHDAQRVIANARKPLT